MSLITQALNSSLGLESAPGHVDHASLNQSFEEFQTVSNDLAELQEIESNLEAMQITLESVDKTLIAGDNPEKSAAALVGMINRDVQGIYKKLGLESTTPAVSLENHTMVVSVEGIKETAKKISDAIKQALMKLYDMISDLFFKLFNSFSGLGKQLSGLEDEVKDIASDATPKSSKIKLSNAAYIASSPSVAEKDRKEFDMFYSYIEDSHKVSSAAVGDLSKTVDNLRGRLDNTMTFVFGSELAKTFGQLISLYPDNIGSEGDVKDFAKKEGFDYGKQLKLPNGNVLITSKPNSELSAAPTDLKGLFSSVTKICSGSPIMIHRATKAKDQDKEVSVLNKSEMEEAIKMIKATITDLTDRSTNYRKLRGQLRKDLFSAMTGYLKTIGSQGVYKEMYKMTNDINRFLGRSYVNIEAELLNVEHRMVSATLQQISKSVAEHK